MIWVSNSIGSRIFSIWLFFRLKHKLLEKIIMVIPGVDIVILEKKLRYTTLIPCDCHKFSVWEIFSLNNIRLLRERSISYEWPERFEKSRDILFIHHKTVECASEYYSLILRKSISRKQIPHTFPCFHDVSGVNIIETWYVFLIQYEPNSHSPSVGVLYLSYFLYSVWCKFEDFCVWHAWIIIEYYKFPASIMLSPSLKPLLSWRARPSSRALSRHIVHT